MLLKLVSVVARAVSTWQHPYHMIHIQRSPTVIKALMRPKMLAIHNIFFFSFLQTVSSNTCHITERLLEHVLASLSSQIDLHSILQCNPHAHLTHSKINCFSEPHMTDIVNEGIGILTWPPSNQQSQYDERQLGRHFTVTLDQQWLQQKRILRSQLSIFVFLEWRLP